MEDAKRDHQYAQQAYSEHAASLQDKAGRFQKEQGDIDRTLMIVTQSETSDDAVLSFQAIMDSLRKFDVAAGYVEMLKEVDILRYAY